MSPGCRVGEIASLQINNVTFDEKGAVLTVIGKTGARRFGAGVFAVIIGFLIISVPIYLITYHAPKDMSLMQNIFFRAIIGVFCTPFILYIIFGFWSIRFSYRNPHYSHFNVLEPGKVVISKEGIIKNRTLKEYSNN